MILSAPISSARTAWPLASAAPAVTPTMTWCRESALSIAQRYPSPIVRVALLKLSALNAILATPFPRTRTSVS